MTTSELQSETIFWGHDNSGVIHCKKTAREEYPGTERKK